MITGSEIYWITRFDAIRLLFVIMGLISILIEVIYLIGGLVVACGCPTGSEQEKKGFRIMRRALLITAIPLLVFAGRMFVPTTKEMCAIKVIPIIANSEGVQELPNKAVELANEWMEELKPKSKTNPANQ